jgi:exopolyphosphatase/guanosine-5'-triphosphate,3'-diphosphate pyrophosphatase
MRIAAIDIGTNSLHMIVCRVRPDLSFEVIDREKDMVRLGAGGLDGRRLADGSMRAAIHTLSKFMRLAASRETDEVIATATSAVREAENGAEFVEAVRDELGVHVRVISGIEEARLIHLAAAYAVDIRKRSAVVIDIGGGSTEITLGTAERMALGRSFKLGVIRLTERFVRTDPLSSRDEHRLVRYIRDTAGSYLAQIGRRRVDRVIGTSGTMLSLGALAEGRAPGDDMRNMPVSAKAMRRLRKRLTAMPLQERLRLRDFDPRRADLAPAGVVLIDTLLEGLGADTLTLCDFALREGLVLDYIAKNAAHIRTIERYPDVRRRSVTELAERYNYAPAHAQQVARLALALFDATRSRHRLGPREREWLEYAALMHDVGTHISYERHHRHSYYLIRHGGLRGFSPEEVEIIALIARYHRQATPKKSHAEFARLSPKMRDTVRLLSACVRLAEGLDRSHAQAVSALRVRLTADQVTVTLTSAGDLDLELWAASRHAAALGSALGADIAFEISTVATRRARSQKTPPHPRHVRQAAPLSRTPPGRRKRRVQG